MESLVDSLDLHLFINLKFTHSTIVKVFERLGAEEVRIVDTQIRDDAFSWTASLSDRTSVSGIFFIGGNQARITSVLKKTEVQYRIHLTK